MLSYETGSKPSSLPGEGLAREAEDWCEDGAREDLRMLLNVARLIEERTERGADSDCEGKDAPRAELPSNATMPISSILSIIYCEDQSCHNDTLCN
jgi:hypothetical protein